MNCPHCSKHIPGFTGLQEAQNFQRHLDKCKKNPANTITDGRKTVLLGKQYSLIEAVNIRAESNQ